MGVEKTKKEEEWVGVGRRGWDLLVIHKRD